jgi:hypothetical protein
MAMEEEHYLNDTWTLYYHSAADSDWTVQSYQRLGQIGSIEEFCQAYATLAPHVHKAIWFLFREHVFPSWDDPSNIDGACLSIKVLKQNAADFWKRLCARMLGETMTSVDNTYDINGMSISPKKNFVIIKLWVKRVIAVEDLDFGGDYDGEVFYKPNRESIVGNQVSLVKK